MTSLLADMPRDTRFLLGARAARSVGQGALIVAFALYLKALGWSAAGIGALFTAGLLLDASLVTVSGPASDRFGRKRFLLIFEAVQTVAAIAAILTAQPVVLAIAALAGGFGRGANGSSGPFAPVELSWLSQTLAADARGRIYSLNMALGFTGMGIGALLAGLPVLFADLLPGAVSYRPLFGLSLAGSLICFGLLAAVADRPAPVPSTNPAIDRDTRRSENTLLAKLFGINAINGVAIGLIGPLMAYWFAVRFGRGPDTIGAVMAIAYFVTAGSSVAAARLVDRIGTVASVVWMRALGVVILLALPLVPSFWMAAVLHILRSALNRGTAGARQALTVSLVRDHRRGTAASTSSLAIQLPRAIGPVFAGALFGAGYLTAPFFIAAGFFSAYIVLFGRTFAAYDPNRTPASEARR
ncbi:MFS transporter [Salinisphaera sp. SPP-AMP-43]|uniref:MFS transporter n=1 Tax=Salinisphaera sp. SPP-AMP-43 TaxID=3121288 RepID=UPI003C6E01C8